MGAETVGAKAGVEMVGVTMAAAEMAAAVRVVETAAAEMAEAVRGAEAMEPQRLSLPGLSLAEK